jgi:hypothetical protein
MVALLCGLCDSRGELAVNFFYRKERKDLSQGVQDFDFQ